MRKGFLLERHSTRREERCTFSPRWIRSRTCHHRLPQPIVLDPIDCRPCSVYDHRFEASFLHSQSNRDWFDLTDQDQVSVWLVESRVEDGIEDRWSPIWNRIDEPSKNKVNEHMKKKGIFMILPTRSLSPHLVREESWRQKTKATWFYNCTWRRWVCSARPPS